MRIREALTSDFDDIWLIFNEIVKTGDTYNSHDTTKKQALDIWLKKPRKTFVFEENGKILGTYYLKTNQNGKENMFVTVATWFHYLQEVRV